MTDLYVKIDSECIHSYCEDREWGSWEETWRNSFDGVSLDKDRFYYPEQTPIDFEVNKGDIVYVVWAEYSSGDSFGHGENKYVEILHVFKDKDLAWQAYHTLLDPSGEEYKDWTVRFKTDSGVEVKYHRPWLGYFDSLGDLHVEEVIVK